MSALIRRMLTAGIAVLCLTLPVLAGSHYDPLQALNGQYAVSATATELGLNSYKFAYDITNVNQGSGAPAGLDAFELLVPVSATITNVSNPLSYGGSPGFWAFSERAADQPGFKTLYWYGGYEQSIYPVGTIAHFSFQANGVAVGSSTEKLTTYKYGTATDWYYAPFSGATVGPGVIPVPEPAALCFSAWAWPARPPSRGEREGKRADEKLAATIH
jgi:hypothetical protein